MELVNEKAALEKYDDPWAYITDAHQYITNKLERYSKNSNDYKYYSKLLDVFNQEMNTIMQSFGYCCGRVYKYYPQLLPCQVKRGCVIQRNAFYYKNEPSNNTICTPCYNEAKGDKISLSDKTTNATVSFKKKQFDKLKNDYTETEPFVTCKCGRRMHQVCTLHIQDIAAKARFRCITCQPKRYITIEPRLLRASSLPCNSLSSFIEHRVNNMLWLKQIETNAIHIRVLTNARIICEVLPKMSEACVKTNLMSGSLPYQSKGIFAFQDFDGVDVCIFAMYVQEYGSDCPEPNKQRAYIAYIDSVNFFQPERHRTAVYHEIVLGYMHFLKRIGFKAVHIWACPPKAGNDYIFNCHPVQQKVPTERRLIDWYIVLFKKGIREGIVFQYVDLYVFALAECWKTICNMPYFDGDHWPHILEFVAAGDSGTDRKDVNKPPIVRLMELLRNYRSQFFVVSLNAPDEQVHIVTDPDRHVLSPSVESRDTFLSECRDTYLEFSTLRRAKYSTMVMLSKLYWRENMDIICNTCSSGLKEGRFRCITCPDFDVCLECYKKNSHEHDVNVYEGNKKVAVMKSRKYDENSNCTVETFLMDKWIEDFEHAGQCKKKKCYYVSCATMKSILEHPSKCTQNTKKNLNCRLCTKLLILVRYHSLKCNAKKCMVPHCKALKMEMGN